MSAEEIDKGTVQSLLENWVVDCTAQTESTIVVEYDESIGVNLARAFATYICSMPNIAASNNAMPVFITPDAEVGRREGFNIPSEFLLSLFELDKLRERMKQLRALHPKGISKEELRAFCVGAFRRFLFLDDDNHGRGELDLMQVRSGRFKEEGSSAWQHWIEDGGWLKIYRDLLVCGEGDPICQMYRRLFSEDMNIVMERMENLGEKLKNEVRK